MKLKLLYYWEHIRGSFWFVPTLMLFAATLLSWFVVRLDAELDTSKFFFGGWGYSGDSDGASAVLSTVAGSMITIAGVVFSITLVALSLASSQFGPRMLRNFIRDRVNQVALGAFVSTFLYCLLVLRTIRHDDAAPFVPHLAVALAVVLAVVSIFVLIYFIHHVAINIQADTLIDEIYTELRQRLDAIYPQTSHSIEHAGATDPAELGAPHRFDQDPGGVRTTQDDYVQAIDLDTLLEVASTNDFVVRVERRPGDYVIAGSLLFSVWPAEKADEDNSHALRGCVVFGAQRTATQDIAFAIDQMVEIAARALSPGINDPFTAIVCIDRLGSAMAQLAQRDLPSPIHVDVNGRPRVIAPPVNFSDILDAAFSSLRVFAHGNAQVTLHMVEILREIETLATRRDDRAALERHAMMLMRSADAGLAESEDSADVRRRYVPLLAALRRKFDR